MKKQIFTMSLLLFFGFGLYAQPKAVGEPRVLAQMTDEPMQTPVWSPDGSKLFLNNGTLEISVNGTDFRRVSAPVSNLRRTAATATANSLFRQMINDPVNVASQVQGLQSLSGNLIFSAALSPTGDKIAFEAGNKGLYVINTDGTGLRSFGFGVGNATWTADGNYVVVQQVEDDGYYFTKGELKSINVETGARSVLFSSDKFITLSPAISPDGRRIAFEEYLSGAVYIMDIQ
jgi:Tol biopolymer transport system component